MARKEVSRTEIFETMPIYKAIIALAIPNIINQLANVVYNLADTFFVGKLNNSSMVAALSLTAMVILVLTAFSNLFSIGSCAVIARSLGEKNKKKAEDIATMAPIMAAAVGVIITILVILFRKQIALYSGANETSLEYTMQYQFWVVGMNAVPILCSTTLGAGLRGRGYAKYEMYGITLGNILNVILDPIFIFAFGMGVRGAAIATFISTFISLVFFIFISSRMQKREHLYTPLKEFKFDFSYAWQIMTTGFPAFLNSFLASIVHTRLMNAVKGYSDAAIAAMGIARKIEHTFGQAVIGLNHGIIPLISYNYGNKNLGRLKEVRNKSAALGLIWGLICAVIVFPLARQIITIFINDEATIAYGIGVVRMYAFLPLGMSYNNNVRTTLQALGKKKTASIYTIGRLAVLYLPMMYLLTHFFGFYGTAFTPISIDIVSDIVGFFLMRRIFRQIQDEFEQKSP